MYTRTAVPLLLARLLTSVLSCRVVGEHSAVDVEIGFVCEDGTWKAKQRKLLRIAETGGMTRLTVEAAHIITETA